MTTAEVVGGAVTLVEPLPWYIWRPRLDEGVLDPFKYQNAHSHACADGRPGAWMVGMHGRGYYVQCMRCGVLLAPQKTGRKSRS